MDIWKFSSMAALHPAIGLFAIFLYALVKIVSIQERENWISLDSYNSKARNARVLDEISSGFRENVARKRAVGGCR